ncbi:spore germination lipoprotein GerD [Bacillus salitolerans]|uniref:Spore germination lipoprotein GerD n=1 Tax=Bacillus salitolerans TaxID=1437434 RepID=A0ABW4LUL2_9BACI
MGKLKLLLLFIVLFTLAACAGGGEQGSGQADYEQTKKMVVDILKTDEGKKAIEEVMSDDSMKQALVMDQAIVTETIQTTLTSKEGNQFWSDAFKDPKFAETFAKSMQSEHEKLIKGLMKDPEYQKMLMEVFQNPDVEKQITTLLKSTEFRGHLQQVITETFESPLFKAKIADVVIKAAEEMQQSGGKKEEGGGGGGGSEEGGDSGSGAS